MLIAFRILDTSLINLAQKHFRKTFIKLFHTIFQWLCTFNSALLRGCCTAGIRGCFIHNSIDITLQIKDSVCMITVVAPIKSNQINIQLINFRIRQNRLHCGFQCKCLRKTINTRVNQTDPNYFAAMFHSCIMCISSVPKRCLKSFYTVVRIDRRTTHRVRIRQTPFPRSS